eukprot:GHUV01051609.1.p1 GENE.GHUV01051609.1~~GHUV01051609.1.p1  ORF type:complete len:115 (-),score=0.60 GHUV01051609.1:217-561(-)
MHAHDRVRQCVFVETDTKACDRPRDPRLRRAIKRLQQGPEACCRRGNLWGAAGERYSPRWKNVPAAFRSPLPEEHRFRYASCSAKARTLEAQESVSFQAALAAGHAFLHRRRHR